MPDGWERQQKNGVVINVDPVCGRFLWQARAVMYVPIKKNLAFNAKGTDLMWIAGQGYILHISTFGLSGEAAEKRMRKRVTRLTTAYKRAAHREEIKKTLPYSTTFVVGEGERD
jgi:hypothetical protein